MGYFKSKAKALPYKIDPLITLPFVKGDFEGDLIF